MFDDRSPIYRQIADRIRDDVLGGALGPDDPVMSTNQYAAFYGINPATVAKAFHELLAEEIIYKRRGIGMFVSPDAAQRLRAERRTNFFTDDLSAVLERARVLGIPIQEILDHIHTHGPGADVDPPVRPQGATP